MENYLVAMATFAGIYALLALGLNLVWGLGGMINLGLVGFFAFGAYVSALLTKKAGVPIAAGLVAAMIATAAAGAVMAVITARLRGDYLAIITLGFSEVVRITASNEIWLTNGTDGISGIPGPYRGRVTPETFNLIFLVIVAVVVGVLYLILERVRRSPYGRVLRAIRDDDQVAAVAGKPVLAFKVESFAVSAAVLGLAGGLYGHYTSYIAPEVFVPLVSIYIVLALTAGGTGENRGAVVGAVLVVFFLESARFATGWLPGLRPVQVAAVRELLIGASLILVLRFRPGGLLPERIEPVPRPAEAAS
jgi:branched-chain amino acid transport system permease protein